MMESILLYFVKSKQYSRLWFQSKFKEPIGSKEMGEEIIYNFSCLFQFFAVGWEQNLSGASFSYHNKLELNSILLMWH